MTNLPKALERRKQEMRRTAELLEAGFEHLEPRAIESLQGVMNMWREEDAGWLAMGHDQQDGLSLTDLKQWSAQLRESVAGNPHIKRGAELRSDYINEGGIRFGGLGGQRSRISQLIDSDMQQRRYFGPTARAERYRACYTDGGVFFIGKVQKDKSRGIEAQVPLHEIISTYRNPENWSEVWAYLREWRVGNNNDSTPKTKKMWYYTDVFEENRSRAKNPTISYGGKAIPVAKDAVIFDAFVNTQVGWTFGVPHALAALAWARLYRDFLVNGKIMSDALAQFAFQLQTKSKGGTQNASMKLASRSGPGQTVVGPNEMTPMATAGKGYDFDSGRALASVVATAIGVSVIHLTADPGTAGSSYGSAQTLDLPTRLSVEAERRWNVELDLRVLRWMGAKNPTAEFNPLISATDVYREIQALKLAFDAGLFEGTPIQQRMADILGIVEQGDVPEGMLLPNNEETVNISKPDPDTGDPDDDSDGAQAGGAGQGQKTGAGIGPKDRSTRDDSNADKAASK